MKTLKTSLVVLALASGSPSFAFGAPVQNVIKAVGVSDRGGGVELDIRGTGTPNYTVFKLQDPPRLVVDLASADVSRIATPIQVGRGGVKTVSTTQYQDARSSIGRIIVAIEPDARYEVEQRAESVLVRVDRSQAKTPPKAESARAGSGSSPRASSTTTSAKPADEIRSPTQKPPQANRPSSQDEHLVSERFDEIRVKRAASELLSVRTLPGRVTLSTNGEVAKVGIIELRNPARLALDLYGVVKAPKSSSGATGPFTQVRIGKDVGKTRVVLDAPGEMPLYEVKRVQGGLAVVIRPATAASQKPRTTPAASVPIKAPAERKVSAVQDLRFSQSGGNAKIDLVGRASHSITYPDSRTVMMTLEGVQLPKRLERSLDTSAFNGPVSMVSSFNQPSVNRAVVVASLRSEASDHVVETPNGLSWTFSREKSSSSGTVADESATSSASEETEVAGFAAEAPGYALSGAPQQRQAYSGRRITLDFHDIEIRNLLRLIAEVSKKNIVVADDVSGKVTVALKNVPWDQALDMILRTKGLDKEEIGNVIRVAKMEQIAKEQKDRAEAAKARLPLLPLKVRLIPINFARAADMAARVKEVLTERGSVSTDDRTNVLIVKDVEEALVRAEGLVRNLDTETPLVLIESRIVEASSNFNREIGIQWGGNISASNATGNPTGLAFPNVLGMTGGAGGGPTTGTATAPNYAVNMPAAIGQGSGGGVGFTFGTASGSVNINLRLSALENSGVAKTISAPKIATIDNKEATIGQGISIPFSQTSSSGVNTTFIEAKLELKVTPHVTADGSILMKIKATNNAANSGLTGANGQPSITKREAETEVLVKDGDTTVIGGIYTRSTASSTSTVPFLGKIPILGFFFRNRSEQDDYTELLIFITPRILNRSATATAAGR